MLAGRSAGTEKGAEPCRQNSQSTHRRMTEKRRTDDPDASCASGSSVRHALRTAGNMMDWTITILPIFFQYHFAQPPSQSVVFRKYYAISDGSQSDSDRMLCSVPPAASPTGTAGHGAGHGGKARRNATRQHGPNGPRLANGPRKLRACDCRHWPRQGPGGPEEQSRQQQEQQGVSQRTRFNTLHC
jgi:hypothetical protein